MPASSLIKVLLILTTSQNSDPMPAVDGRQALRGYWVSTVGAQEMPLGMDPRSGKIVFGFLAQGMLFAEQKGVRMVQHGNILVGPGPDGILRRALQPGAQPIVVECSNERCDRLSLVAVGRNLGSLELATGETRSWNFSSGVIEFPQPIKTPQLRNSLFGGTYVPIELLEKALVLRKSQSERPALPTPPARSEHEVASSRLGLAQTERRPVATQAPVASNAAMQPQGKAAPHDSELTSAVQVYCGSVPTPGEKAGSLKCRLDPSLDPERESGETIVLNPATGRTETVAAVDPILQIRGVRGHFTTRSSSEALLFVYDEERSMAERPFYVGLVGRSKGKWKVISRELRAQFTGAEVDAIAPIAGADGRQRLAVCSHLSHGGQYDSSCSIWSFGARGRLQERTMLNLACDGTTSHSVRAINARDLDADGLVDVEFIIGDDEHPSQVIELRFLGTPEGLFISPDAIPPSLDPRCGRRVHK